jgi:AcrR family transcriptional regulator
MAGTRKRIDPRAATTQAALIETAEKLFGEHGIDNVSMRQLGQAIGSANTNVVAYHFGGKDELVAAVIRHRLGALEQRRADLLAALPDDGLSATLPELLNVLHRPFFEQTNSEGRHSYVAFLVSLIRADMMVIRTAMSADYPVTGQVIERLRALLAAVAYPYFYDRMEVATLIVFGQLQIIDRRGRTGGAAEAAFADCLRLVEAVLRAPAS